jgi:peptide-methionine (S)-S-oxide reductase
MFRIWLSLAFLALAAPVPGARAAEAVATFAGGCFWCVESDFDKVDGVLKTISGYMGGDPSKANYKQVSAGGTGHAEVVQVTYDPAKVSYDKLLDTFWKNIDPLAKDRQFCDSGDMYRSAVFFHSEEQRKAAEATRAKVAARFGPKQIHTQVVAAGTFFPAEDYHQDYYLKNPSRYSFYRWNCGRDKRLEELWGKSEKGPAS